jgi:hypothetical protein
MSGKTSDLYVVGMLGPPETWMVPEAAVSNPARPRAGRGARGGEGSSVGDVDRGRGSTLVTQYRQDHRPTWWVWVGSKQLLRISDPDTHYVTGMEATLEALANAAPA